MKRLWRYAPLLVLLLLSLNPLHAQESTFKLTIDGNERTFSVFIPSYFDNKTQIPLVIALHPAGESALNFAKNTGFSQLAEEQNFAVIYPEGLRGYWDYGTGLPGYVYSDMVDDLSFLRAVIEQTVAVLNVDPERVYVVGFSSGAHMAFRLACEMSDQITGIVSVAGSLSDFVAENCPGGDTVSVIMIHGTKDAVMEYNGETLTNTETGKIDGYALSAPDGIQFWADFNGCDSESEFRLGTDPKIGMFNYNNCDSDARVTLYRIKDGGHEWPNALFGGNIARFTWQLFEEDVNAKLPTPNLQPEGEIVAEDGKISFGDLERQVEVHVPPDYDGETALPLVIALHPLASSPKAMMALTGLNDVADEAGFIVAYPQTATYFWADGLPRDYTQANPNDVGFITALADYLAGEYNIDPARVYLAGYGNGATMAFTIACNAPGKFAGIAVVAGLMWATQRDESCQTDVEAPVNLLVMLGTDDANYPVEGRVIEGEPGDLPIQVLSLDRTLNFWLTRNGCDSETPTETPPAVSYVCDGDTRVALYAIENGSSSWPRPGRYGLYGNIEASEVIWSFFNGDENWAETGQHPDIETPDYDGPARSYSTLYVPSTYDGDTALPLVIALHGRPGNGAGFAVITDMNKVAEENGFIVVYPDGYNREWNYIRNVVAAASTIEEVDDVAFLSALVDNLALDLNIDRSRVYLTGFSNGGFMTHRIACEVGETFAAYAMVGASLPTFFSDICVNSTTPVPVMMIIGTEDTLWEALQQPFGESNVTTYISAPDTAGFYVVHNQCDVEPAEEAIPDGSPDDGTEVQVFSFEECAGESEVQFYVVFGGGHNWPGVMGAISPNVAGKVNTDIHAGEVIWDFFSRHQLAEG